MNRWLPGSTYIQTGYGLKLLQERHLEGKQFSVLFSLELGEKVSRLGT
jgi:hypothetical protein